MRKRYWKDITTDKVDGATDRSVWTAVQLWIERPHLLNRRLSGVAEVHRSEGPLVLDTSKLSAATAEWSATLSQYLPHLQDMLDQSSDKDYVLLVREMISRTVHYANEYEAVLISKEDQWVIFLPLRDDACGDGSVKNGTRKFSTANCAYRIGWREMCTTKPSTQVTISVLREEHDDGAGSKSEDWLKEHLLPKLVSWASKPQKEEGTDDNGSLKLISVKEYTRTLLDLKEKYSRNLIAVRLIYGRPANETYKIVISSGALFQLTTVTMCATSDNNLNWTESTDPIKFVSEDLCIAAYLFTLWRSKDAGKENHSIELPSFADLGCGNGLLVHILSAEGCHGVGIDVRSRKIWQSFGSSTQLEERTVDPSTDIFPHVDWIIGNHTDELTPWIPYIAARSSYRCKFFLLPCCAFDFNKKFSKAGNESQYSAYYKYVHSLCQEFGFQTEQDTLRIPSTKKRCFIGRTRAYPEAEQALQLSRNQVFLTSRLEDRPANFVVREAVEEVRNCSRLPQTVKDTIIHRVMEELLKEPAYVEGAKGRWNAGCGLSLAELSARLEPQLLDAMRNQCGGLQTFIRNHKFIFCIDSGGVRLRNYACDTEKTLPSNTRRQSKPVNGLQNTSLKPCFFFQHHPDGCPLASANCAYRHEGALQC